MEEKTTALQQQQYMPCVRCVAFAVGGGRCLYPKYGVDDMITILVRHVKSMYLIIIVVHVFLNMMRLFCLLL